MAEASSGGQCMLTIGCGLQPNNPRTTNRQTVPLPLFSRPAFACSVSTCGLCPDRFHETGNQTWPRQKGKRRCYGQTKNPRERLRGKDGVQNLHISLHSFTVAENNLCCVVSYKQTRRTKNPVGVTLRGFKSLLRHQPQIPRRRRSAPLQRN